MNLRNYDAEKPFAQKHLLCLQSYTPDEILQVLSLALRIKDKQKLGIAHEVCKNKSLAMIFTKSSTRTRVSFEVGFAQLGGRALFLSGSDIQLGRSETVEDTAQVLSRYVDGIMIRTFAQSDVEALAAYGTIPVINGLTDDYHPCQALADYMTLYEKKGELKGRTLAYVGDGNNVAHSLLICGSKLGVNVAVATPRGYEPSSAVLAWAKTNAAAAGSTILVTNDPMEAVAGADAVYTDVFTSMGQEDERQKRDRAFIGYCVTPTVMRAAQPDAVFMHCLPAHRGEEVSPEVIDGPQSVVFDEAENRLHAQKAVMALLMG